MVVLLNVSVYDHEIMGKTPAVVCTASKRHFVEVFG